MTINDIGPRPQSLDIEKATQENTAYRAVAWSGRYLQVTLMSIPLAATSALKRIRRLISSCASIPVAVTFRWGLRKTS